MRLNARYTVKTDDGHYLYIKAKGIFNAGPNQSEPILSESRPPPENISQDEVEWFTHLNIEAGPGPYHWLNSVIAIGVLAMHEKKIVIDAYRITNFPGVTPKDVKAA